MPSISSINVYQLYTIVYSLHHGTLELEDTTDLNDVEMMGMVCTMEIYENKDNAMVME